LISSAGDLVAALANALGADFAPAFGTFFPLIAKYYVSFSFNFVLVHFSLSFRKRIVHSVTDRRPSDALPKSLRE